MSNLILPPDWALPESAAVSEWMYTNRRRFLRQLGYTGGGLATLLAGCGDGSGGAGIRAGEEEASGGPIAGDQDPTSQPADAEVAGAGPEGEPPTLPKDAEEIPDDIAALYPAERNAQYVVDDRPTTAEEVAGRYNNFYEFTTAKHLVWQKAEDFNPRPWEVEVRGMCAKPGTYGLDDLVRRVKDRMEERLYRFRCVEAWSMVVPWTGVPLGALLDLFEPQAGARYVRFLTVLRPTEMPGQADSRYPWPYFEGLRMDEAYHPLAMATFGIFGHPIPNQHGAPFRVITPWKYGFKNIKSVVLIEFQDHQPPTFWNDLVPREYDFLANVDPAAPHPRWSQATERDIGQDNKLIDTLPYNGYADQVASLYS